MIQDPFGLAPLSIKLVNTDRRKVIMLERIEDTPEPGYCVHGRTKCMSCGKWCHLGKETLKVVERGEATPVCIPCGTPLIDKDNLIGYVKDRQEHP